jgi:predicted enzyme related to lactoylglutathione lyase
MRTRLIWAFLAFVLTTGLSAAPEQKGPKPDVGDGRVAWFDITSTNLTQSKAFYAGLFGWEFTSVPGGENLALEIVSGGQPIGTLRVAEGKISPYDGVVYIQVKDMPASCAKAKELGGMIPPGFPFNLSDGRGAIALVADPAGHPVGMYSRTPLPAAAK